MDSRDTIALTLWASVIGVGLAAGVALVHVVEYVVRKVEGMGKVDDV